MRAFFDTETTGLWHEKLAWDDPSQPHVAQLGVRLYDAKWKTTGHFAVLIKPDGWSMEPEAEAHHGISEARCARHGVPLAAALVMLKGLVENTREVVAHHLEFDRRVVRAALRRLGSDGLWWERKAPHFFCTMEAATPVCQLPGDYGFKFPSLEEAHRFFYPEVEYDTDHEAEADVLACMRVYRGLEGLGLTPGARK